MPGMSRRPARSLLPPRMRKVWGVGALFSVMVYHGSAVAASVRGAAGFLRLGG